jgi:hypothetical protein
VTTIEKVVVAIMAVLVIVIAISARKCSQVMDSCVPSIVTETRDGKEVTSVECKP